ncbi:hypothetical protein Esti_002599 [Eimeria stiedai]
MHAASLRLLPLTLSRTPAFLSLSGEPVATLSPTRRPMHACSIHFQKKRIGFLPNGKGCIRAEGTSHRPGDEALPFCPHPPFFWPASEPLRVHGGESTSREEVEGGRRARAALWLPSVASEASVWRRASTAHTDGKPTEMREIFAQVTEPMQICGVFARRPLDTASLVASAAPRAAVYAQRADSRRASDPACIPMHPQKQVR